MSKIYSLDELNKQQKGRNLLINGDFSVWQRGETGHSAANTFCADRWKIRTASTHITRLPPNGISIEGTHFSSGILQRIEGNSADGKQVTLSFDVKSGYAATLYIYWKNSEGVGGNISYIPTIDWNRRTFTFTLADDPVSTYQQIDLQIGGGFTLDVKNIKVDLGPKATEFDATLPSINLLNCRRYFRISEATGQAAEFQHDMRALPVETGTGPYSYDAEL